LVERAFAKAWSCVFVARSASRARAVFATKAEAIEFAERHARAFLGTSEPLMWEDAKDSSVLITSMGEYLVTRMDNPRP
jgi:hypothetical protein